MACPYSHPQLIDTGMEIVFETNTDKLITAYILRAKMIDSNGDAGYHAFFLIGDLHFSEPCGTRLNALRVGIDKAVFDFIIRIAHDLDFSNIAGASPTAFFFAQHGIFIGKEVSRKYHSGF